MKNPGANMLVKVIFKRTKTEHNLHVFLDKQAGGPDRQGKEQTINSKFQPTNILSTTINMYMYDAWPSRPLIEGTTS